MIRFNGAQIFGEQTRQEGPVPAYRTQDEQLPGVDGVRSYRLGAGATSWTVEGRLFAVSWPQLQALLQAGGSYVNGRAYAFEDTFGTSNPNCQLTDYRPAGPVQVAVVAGIAGATVRVRGTVRQLSPPG